MDKILFARLFSKIEVIHQEYCWLWRDRCSLDGYGCFTLRHGKTVSAHRLAFALFHDFNIEEMSPEYIVRHECDNPTCCNPLHLIGGTQADNMRDKVVRARTSRGDKNGRAILNESQVRAIHKDDRTHLEIAAEYGVNRATIYDIKRGRNWKHVARELGIEMIQSATGTNRGK